MCIFYSCEQRAKRLPASGALTPARLLTEENDYGQTYLYEGASGYDFPDFYEWRHTKKELRQAFYDWNVRYAVMMKGTQFEKEHGEDTLGEKGVGIVFENEAGYVLSLDLFQTGRF